MALIFGSTNHIKNLSIALPLKKTVYSPVSIQTAKLHGHQVNQYLAVILTELPKAQTAEDYEAY